VNNFSAVTKWLLRMKLHQGPDCSRTYSHRQIYRPTPKCSKLILTIRVNHSSSFRLPTAVSLGKIRVSDITMNQTNLNTWRPEKQLSQSIPPYLNVFRVTWYLLSNYTNSKWLTQFKMMLIYWCTRLQKNFSSRQRPKSRIRLSQTKKTFIDSMS